MSVPPRISMRAESAVITDIWFRSALSLSDLADAIGLAEAERDAENRWEWVIGTVIGIALDLTREHSRLPATVDTRIFRVDQQPFSPDQKAELIRRLRGVVPTPIMCGRWVYLHGDEFDLRTAETH